MMTRDQSKLRRTPYWLLLASLITLFNLHGRRNAPTAEAQSSIQATVTLSNQQLFAVGDVVRLTLSATHPAGFRLIPADLSEAWGSDGIEVLSVGPVQTSEAANGTETSQQLIDVTAWEPASYTTPILTVQISDPQGNLQSVTAGTVSFEIGSLIDTADTQLRDLKPQADVSGTSQRLLLLLLTLGVGLMLVGLGGFLMFRRSNTTTGRRQAPDLRPAHVIALDEIEAIVAKRLPVKGDMKGHYTQIADVLRRYVGKTYGFPTLDATTAEIRRSVGKVTTAETSQGLTSLLTEADLVKFAKLTPDTDTANDFPTRARKWIETAVRTAPRPSVATDSAPSRQPVRAAPPLDGADQRRAYQAPRFSERPIEPRDLRDE